MKKAESLPPQEVDDLFRHLYGQMPDNLVEQMEYLKDSLETREIEEDSTEIKGGFP